MQSQTRPVACVVPVLLVLVMCMFLHPMISFAQQEESIADLTRLDLAVPDNPANNILGLRNTEILRPSSLREVSVLLGDLFSLNSTIPKSISFEVAPLLMLSEPSLNEFKDLHWAYSTRISIATSEGKDGGRQIALGIRMSLLDQSDLRVNQELIDEYRVFGKVMSDFGTQCLEENTEWALLDDEDRDQRIKQCAKEKLTSATRVPADKSIAAIREKAKQDAWNEAILEIGAALAAQSQDSLAANLMSSSYSAWLTWAQPFLGEKGQLLLGMKGRADRNGYGGDWFSEASIALRGYFGTNSFKGFLEGDFLARDDRSPAVSAAAGIEVNLSNGIWIDASAGLEKVASRSAAITHDVSLRIATPELVK
ncbi:MAG: hypothetical protein C0600_13780 [Ignavibacteria bacterium]|nr:MAG: hypothetical protein C0600_13780 [Ignavibacteria bacterium]